MTQQELQQLQILLEKAHKTLGLTDFFTHLSIKSEDGELVLVGDNLWIQNAYGKSRKVSSKSVKDTEIIIY